MPRDRRAGSEADRWARLLEGSRALLAQHTRRVGWRARCVMSSSSCAVALAAAASRPAGAAKGEATGWAWPCWVRRGSRLVWLRGGGGKICGCRGRRMVEKSAPRFRTTTSSPNTASGIAKSTRQPASMGGRGALCPPPARLMDSVAAP